MNIHVTDNNILIEHTFPLPYSYFNNIPGNFVLYLLCIERNTKTLSRRVWEKINENK